MIKIRKAKGAPLHLRNSGGCSSDCDPQQVATGDMAQEYQDVVSIKLPLIIVIVGLLMSAMLVVTGPISRTLPPVKLAPVLEVIVIHPTNYQVYLNSYGVVRPAVQTTLMPEVKGKVIWVADKLQKGALFQKNDLLARIDPSDYEYSIAESYSRLAEAKLKLEQQQALAEVSVKDWQILGTKDQPPRLTRHKPQLDSARAEVAAAEAQLRHSEKNLERTYIRAPYDGRVLNKAVDIGQYVSLTGELATIYATDFVEIELPVSAKQWELISSSAIFENDRKITPFKVELSGKIGNKTMAREGYIVRSDGVFDESTMQQKVIARVGNNYQVANGQKPLHIGQFVNARIIGERLQSVFVLPRSSIFDRDKVLVVSADNRIAKRTVEIALVDKESVVITSGLHDGEKVAVLPLLSLDEGAFVKTQNAIHEVSGKESAEYSYGVRIE